MSRSAITPEAARAVLAIMREQAAKVEPWIVDGKVDHESFMRELWVRVLATIEYDAGEDVEDLVPRAMFQAATERGLRAQRQARPALTDIHVERPTLRTPTSLDSAKTELARKNKPLSQGRA